MDGAPVSPCDPPMMKTLPEENFVESAVRRGISNSTPPPIRPISASPGAPVGIPMSTTSTTPACALPGWIQRPGLAWWNVAVATARTAEPSTSPVEALTPLGTSAAITRARAALIARMTAPAGPGGREPARAGGVDPQEDGVGRVARRPVEAGAEHRVDDRVGLLQPVGME